MLAITSLSYSDYIPRITFFNYLYSNTNNSLKDCLMPALTCSVFVYFILAYGICPFHQFHNTDNDMIFFAQCGIFLNVII